MLSIPLKHCRGPLTADVDDRSRIQSLRRSACSNRPVVLSPSYIQDTFRTVESYRVEQAMILCVEGHVAYHKVQPQH
jgi:hypothetical protein